MTAKRIRRRNISGDGPPAAGAADRVTAWAQAVAAGEILTGPHVRNAARRHLADLQAGPSRGLVWDAAAAEHAIGFFPAVLRLNGGQFEGLPFELDWRGGQVFKTGSLFGWKRADGTRRFRRAYIEEGKGNGKSPWAAGTGHYCLVADKEPRAEVYAAAANKDQAMVLFRDAVAMRDQSPALADRLKPSGSEPNVWNLADLKTGSFFRPISREKRKSGSGPRPSCALCDEVHEHPDRLVIDMLERGFKFRRQPLLIMITNSGSDRKSVAWQEREHAIRVAAGSRTASDEDPTFVGEPIDDTTFSFVCALDKDDDPLADPSCWPKVNPLLGVILKEDYLADVANQARLIPGKRNGILRLHFCRWTDAETAWISREVLEACLADFDPLVEHADKEVFGGIDLSASQDLTAAAFAVRTGAVEREGDDGAPVMLPTFDLWMEAWTPKDTLPARALRDQAPYEVWVEKGFLHATPGSHIRLDFVAAKLAAIAAILRLIELAYDRYAYHMLADELAALGQTFRQIEHPQGGRRRARLPDDELRAWKPLIDAAKLAGNVPPDPQGLWMPGSLDTLEQLILDRRIRIRRNPVMVSAIMGATLDHDAFDNRWLDKQKATQRIDPAVAACMAIGAATRLRPPANDALARAILARGGFV
jgi:phage terminase large subunit-like protein